ncbi:peptide chain release factor N(5)-glutamine methyltransferase [Rhizobiaceae bacterium]|nr:peptide chain release factor N(5)-glutamine methyltransferase [Rhizobiaceae bacterium]
MTPADRLPALRAALEDAGIADAESVARLIVGEATGRETSTLTYSATPMTTEQLASVNLLAQAIIAGTPVFRAFGHRNFHGLELALSTNTLEPRDDTEALVDATLALIADRGETLRLADLGTGTGAVALALLSELPAAKALATDISLGALETANANAASNGLAARFKTAQGPWLEPLRDHPPFDFIVSNPPYIATATVDTLDPSVRDHDPRVALDGGRDGLDAYRAILSDAAAQLSPTGFLGLEIGYDQRESVSKLARAAGWTDIRCTPDLAGRDRALTMRPDRYGDATN